MIARTLCFTSAGKLSVRDEQLVWDGADGARRTIPLEDIGFVIIESDLIVVTSVALQKIAERNVALVVCDRTHTPAAQMVAYDAHTTSAENIEAQLAVSEAVRGRLWRQVCRRKIENQARLMEVLGVGDVSRMRVLVDAVKNGDPSNCEGQAARLYFQSLGPKGFVRDRYGEWPNAALNYGYAVLRAAVARAIVGSGLVCFNGIHHHNRYNAFALADDLMEPYRPFVDQYVFGIDGLVGGETNELTKEIRARLLGSLTCDVRLDGYRRPLMIALSYTTASLVRCFKGEDSQLLLPEML